MTPSLPGTETVMRMLSSNGYAVSVSMVTTVPEAPTGARTRLGPNMVAASPPAGVPYHMWWM